MVNQPGLLLLTWKYARGRGRGQRWSSGFWLHLLNGSWMVVQFREPESTGRLFSRSRWEDVGQWYLLPDFCTSHNKRTSTDIVKFIERRGPKIIRHWIYISRNKTKQTNHNIQKQNQHKPKFPDKISLFVISYFVRFKTFISWLFFSVLFLKCSIFSLNSKIWFLQLINWLSAMKTYVYICTCSNGVTQFSIIGKNVKYKFQYSYI